MTWSIVLIPDTQHLATPANGWTAIYNGLRDWIVANADTYNVQLVAHLGDIVHTSEPNSWANAVTALEPLWTLDLPVLLLACGNHDFDGGATTRGTTDFNNYFGTDRYDGTTWFGGTYEADKAENLWVTFTVDGHDYLAMALEFFPRDVVMDWAVGVMQDHPNHEVIISTHAYMFDEGNRRNVWGDAHAPAHYGFTGAGDANDGETMWTDWLADQPNLLGVFNGHHIGPPYISYRTDAVSPTRQALQAFYNWQEVGNGGDGRVMLLTVDRDAGTIRHRVVRTDLDSFETGASYDVTHTVWTVPPSVGALSAPGGALTAPAGVLTP